MPASHPDLAFADGSDAMDSSTRPGMDRAEPTPSVDQPGMDRADAEAPERHVPFICVPLLPTLQRYGRAALSAVISSWWQDWRKRQAPLGVSLPLLEALRHRRHYTPEGSLADWMRALGWDGTELTRGRTNTALADGSSNASNHYEAYVGSRVGGMVTSLRWRTSCGRAARIFGTRLRRYLAMQRSFSALRSRPQH